MELPIQIVPDYQCQPYFPSTQQDDEQWDGSHTFRGHHVNRLPAIGSPTQTAMERFLQERDRTWFTTRVNTPLPPFPSLDLEPTGYHGTNGHLDYSYRYPSPTESVPLSAYHSCSHSDNQSTPLSSPNPSAYAQSPETIYLDHPGYGYGLRYAFDEFKGGMGEPCVTMHEVQGYEDAQPEAIPPFEDEGNFYSLPQEGFEPMEEGPEQEHPVNDVVNGVVNGTGSPHRDGNSPSSPESPNIRRRRPTATRSFTSPNKVSKRATSSRRTSSFSKTNGHKTNGYWQSASNRAFPCPFAIYNCTSTFGAKNEWKRHVNTQHMQTGYWRCDQCDQSERKPNDFNRKDLFIQHVRRMHALEIEKPTKTKSASSRPTKNDPEERQLNAIASRCFMPIREPPDECACIVCDAVFTGSTAWDERLEHIGKHWEAMKKDNEEPNDPKEWRDDDALHQFLAKQGIITCEGKRWVLA